MSKHTWNCDFCKTTGLSIAKDGFIYCRNCGMSYHQNIYNLALKLAKEIEHKKEILRK